MIYDAKSVLGLRPGMHAGVLRPKMLADVHSKLQCLAQALDARHP